MERETIKVTTPVDNIEIVIKSYLTGGEKRAIQNVYLEMADVSVGQGQDLNTKLKTSPELMNRAQDEVIKAMVVSIGGNTENVLESALNLKSKDFDFLVEQLNEITSLTSKKK